jgi:hypothetical protein
LIIIEIDGIAGDGVINAFAGKAMASISPGASDCATNST